MKLLSSEIDVEFYLAFFIEKIIRLNFFRIFYLNFFQKCCLNFCSNFFSKLFQTVKNFSKLLDKFFEKLFNTFQIIYAPSAEYHKRSHSRISRWEVLRFAWTVKNAGSVYFRRFIYYICDDLSGLGRLCAGPGRSTLAVVSLLPLHFPHRVFSDFSLYVACWCRLGACLLDRPVQEPVRAVCLEPVRPVCGTGLSGLGPGRSDLGSVGWVAGSSGWGTGSSGLWEPDRPDCGTGLSGRSAYINRSPAGLREEKNIKLMKIVNCILRCDYDLELRIVQGARYILAYDMWRKNVIYIELYFRCDDLSWNRVINIVERRNVLLFVNIK